MARSEGISLENEVYKRCDHGSPLRLCTTVRLVRSGANCSPPDATRGQDVADGYGIRVETGRQDDPWEVGNVELIMSRHGGAMWAVLSPRQARALAAELIRAAEVA